MKQIIPESRVDGNATAMTMSFAAATNSLEAHVNVPPELKRLAPVKRRFLLWGVAIVSAGPAAGSRPGDRTAAAGKHAAVKAAAGDHREHGCFSISPNDGAIWR